MPGNIGVTDEQDWRLVQDRAERRKTQNRIAQRLFRRRTQLARSNSHAQQTKQQRGKYRQNDDKNGYYPSPPNQEVVIASSSTHHSHHSTGQQLPSPISAPSRTSPMQVSMPTPNISICSSILTNEPQFGQPAVESVNSTSSTRLHDHQLNLLIPEGYEWNDNLKTSDAYTLDRLNLSQQAINGRAYGLHGDSAMAQMDPQVSDINNGFPGWRGGTSMEQDVQVPGHLMGRRMSQIDQIQTRGNNNNPWKLEEMSHPVRPNQLAAANNNVLVSQGMTTHNGNGIRRKTSNPAEDSATSSVPDIFSEVPKQTLLHELFECISDPLEASVFPNFDSLVTAYYCETFADSPQLANEQRLSRNRRLPKVIADLFSAAQTWTQWEGRGFYEEILKTAETMLVSEGDSFDMSEISALLDAQGEQNKRKNGAVGSDSGTGVDTNGGASFSEQMASQQTNQELKRLVQDKLPNLWVLFMALAGTGRDPWKQDKSGTALAAVLLLHCGGRVPDQQLIDAITTCLKRG